MAIGGGKGVFGRVDLIISALTLIAVVAAWCSIAVPPRWSWPVICVVDLYLVIVLGVSAYRSYNQQAAIKYPWIVVLFPTRVAGLFVMFGFIAAIVLAFAGLYYAYGTCVFGRALTPWEAIYISFSTLGFNDFTPKSDYGRLVVIAQLSSTLLLIMGVFALLISRLSTFETPESSAEKAASREAATRVLETKFGDVVVEKEKEIAQLKANVKAAQDEVTKLQNDAAPRAAPLADAIAAPKKA